MSTSSTAGEPTSEQLRHREQLRHIAAVRDSEPAAILAALRAGVRQTDIAADLGRTRETIRRITRQAQAAEQAEENAPPAS